MIHQSFIRFHRYFVRLFRTKKLTLFWQMVNGTQIWQILGHKFGKFGSTVWGSVSVNFFAKCPATESFCLAKISGEIDP
jgi:hypothetical protein